MVSMHQVCVPAIYMQSRTCMIVLVATAACAGCAMHRRVLPRPITWIHSFLPTACWFVILRRLARPECRQAAVQHLGHRVCALVHPIGGGAPHMMWARCHASVLLLCCHAALRCECDVARRVLSTNVCVCARAQRASGTCMHSPAAPHTSAATLVHESLPAPHPHPPPRDDSAKGGRRDVVHRPAALCRAAVHPAYPAAASPDEPCCAAGPWRCRHGPHA